MTVSRRHLLTGSAAAVAAGFAGAAQATDLCKAVMKKLFKLDHVSFRTPCLTTCSEQEPSNWSLLRASYPRKRSLTHTPSSSARESL